MTEKKPSVVSLVYGNYRPKTAAPLPVMTIRVTKCHGKSSTLDLCSDIKGEQPNSFAEQPDLYRKKAHEALDLLLDNFLSRTGG